MKQSLDDLWDFNDPGLSETRFREYLEQDLSAPERAEALTQLARTMSLRRRFDEANQILDEADSTYNKVLQHSGNAATRVRVRLLLERGRALNSSGQPTTAKPLFVDAWDLANGCGEDRLAVDAAHMVAIVEDVPGQLEWNGRAMQKARVSTDEKARAWMPSLLNNLGWTYHDEGDYERALALFEEAQVLRAQRGDPVTERIARYCIGRCLRSLGRVEEALAMQRILLAETPGGGVGYIDEEIGECLLALGQTAQCRTCFKAAYEKFAGNDELRGQTERLERIRSLAGAT